MIKLSWEPVVLSMARITFFLKLPFVDILMAINTLFSLGSILLVLMTFFTFRTLVFTYQREFRLFIMVQDILLPICRVMTFDTIIPQFLFMGIVLFMAVKATVRQRLILSVHMAFLTWCLHMFPVKPVTTVIGRIMLKRGWLPAFYNVTCFALFILKLSFMRILMTIRGITALVIKWPVLPLHMTFLTLDLNVFSL